MILADFPICIVLEVSEMRDWLRQIRKDRRMTMKDMGVKLGISESYYCAIENGERQKRMDLALAASLAAVLGLAVAQVVAYEEGGTQNED